VALFEAMLLGLVTGGPPGRLRWLYPGGGGSWTPGAVAAGPRGGDGSLTLGRQQMLDPRGAAAEVARTRMKQRNTWDPPLPTSRPEASIFAFQLASAWTVKNDKSPAA
jgi:hypothetical protein